MRFVKVLVLLPIAIASSVATAQQRADWHQNAIANCQQKLKSGQFKKRVLFAECVNRVNAKAWDEEKTKHRDLLDHAMAQELVAAEAFDRGRATEIEYSAARAKIRSDLASEMNRRTVRSPAPTVIQQSPSLPTYCYTSGRLTTCF